MSLTEINDAVSIIQNEAHDDANIIFGAVIDEEMGDAVSVTVIATGFGRAETSSIDTSEFNHTVRTHTPIIETNYSEKPIARTVVPGKVRESNFPAFIRKSQREKNSRHLSLVDDYNMETEEDLDIPTFLRKHAD